MEPATDFAWAAQHESTLNARQRDVLRLIAAGRTNAEIGDLLGMTLDGAKWNVSEILTKLGLHTREEAAEYWRWRQRTSQRTARLVRALVGAPLGFKAVAGSVVIAAVAVVAGFAWWGGTTGPDSGRRVSGHGPFTLEAAVEVEQEDRSVARSSMTWTYQDPAHWTWRIDNQADGESAIGVADGNAMWLYSSRTNEYTRSDLPETDVPWPPPVSLVVGPAGAMGPDANAVRDHFLTLAGPDGTYRADGTDSVLGIGCEVWVFAPSWQSSSSSNGGPEVRSSGGELRLCINTGSLVILRYESDIADGRSAAAEITRWDDAVPPGATFRFDPPPGSIESLP